MTTKQYPETIDLARYSGISDAEIVKDIADTEYEIANYERLQVAEREIARTHPNPHEARMADFKAGARSGQIAERTAFVAFLRRIQDARAAAKYGVDAAFASTATPTPDEAPR
jgi:hypothetical protein